MVRTSLVEFCNNSAIVDALFHEATLGSKKKEDWNVMPLFSCLGFVRYLFFFRVAVKHKFFSIVRYEIVHVSANSC